MERLFSCSSSTSKVEVRFVGPRVRAERQSRLGSPFVVLLFAGVRLVWCLRKSTSLSVCEYTYMLCVLYLRYLCEPEVSGQS